MSEQPQSPRPQDQTIISVQKQEIDRINDNRMMLMAMLEEMQGLANAEIARLHSVVSYALSLLTDEDQTKVRAMLEDRRLEPEPDPVHNHTHDLPMG